MDETVLKLPKYVFRRPNGSYRYKRNVPKVLQKYIYKKTLYRVFHACIARLSIFSRSNA